MACFNWKKKNQNYCLTLCCLQWGRSCATRMVSVNSVNKKIQSNLEKFYSLLLQEEWSSHFVAEESGRGASHSSGKFCVQIWDSSQPSTDWTLGQPLWSADIEIWSRCWSPVEILLDKTTKYVFSPSFEILFITGWKSLTKASP